MPRAAACEYDVGNIDLGESNDWRERFERVLYIYTSYVVIIDVAEWDWSIIGASAL